MLVPLVSELPQKSKPQFEIPLCIPFINKRQTTSQETKMKIIPIPVLEDNYAYILIDDKTKEAAVIDPVEPTKILNVLSQTGAKLT
ncbi:hypothetical protein BC938DRAFT_484216, partial [Jimgerdemannia flammicorona]